MNTSEKRFCKSEILSILGETSRSAGQISEQLEISKSKVQRCLDELRLARKVRIAQWQYDGRWNKIYELGSGPGKPMPEKAEREKIMSASGILPEARAYGSKSTDITSETLALHHEWDRLNREFRIKQRERLLKEGRLMLP